MSLIKCSECGKGISNKAPSCPNCGNPIISAPNNVLQEAPAVTVQATFKKWKLVKLTSWCVIILGFLFLGGGEAMMGLGAMFIFFGIIGLIIGKFGAWWSTG